MSILRDVVLNPEIVDELLGELNTSVREVDSYEYGLPLHGDHVPALREVIYKWIAKHLGDK